MKTHKPQWIQSNQYSAEKEILFITKDERFRIISMPDYDYDLDDMCKHMFSASDHPDVPKHKLEKQEKSFREKFEEQGAVTLGLEQKEGDEYYLTDSCSGFMGWEDFNQSHHYIKELKSTAAEIMHGELKQEAAQIESEKDQEFIAAEFSKFIAKCGKHGIDADYTAYLTFCIIGGITVKNSPKDFYNYVSEIISKNAS